MAILNSRVFWLFIAPHLVFAVMAIPTGAPGLIRVLNLVVFAFAVGVCLAYGPPVVDTLVSKRPMDRADWLGIGIFVSWGAIIVSRSWSIVWRYLDRPDWLLQNDIVSYVLFMQLFAACCHLGAPGAISERVPPRRWIKIGIAVAVLIPLIAGMAYLFDALTLD